MIKQFNNKKREVHEKNVHPKVLNQKLKLLFLYSADAKTKSLPH